MRAPIRYPNSNAEENKNIIHKIFVRHRFRRNSSSWSLKFSASSSIASISCFKSINCPSLLRRLTKLSLIWSVSRATPACARNVVFDWLKSVNSRWMLSDVSLDKTSHVAPLRRWSETATCQNGPLTSTSMISFPTPWVLRSVVLPINTCVEYTHPASHQTFSSPSPRRARWSIPPLLVPPAHEPRRGKPASHWSASVMIRI